MIVGKHRVNFFTGKERNELVGETTVRRHETWIHTPNLVYCGSVKEIKETMANKIVEAIREERYVRSKAYGHIELKNAIIGYKHYESDKLMCKTAKESLRTISVKPFVVISKLQDTKGQGTWESI